METTHHCFRPTRKDTGSIWRLTGILLCIPRLIHPFPRCACCARYIRPLLPPSIRSNLLYSALLMVNYIRRMVARSRTHTRFEVRYAGLVQSREASPSVQVKHDLVGTRAANPCDYSRYSYVGWDFGNTFDIHFCFRSFHNKTISRSRKAGCGRYNLSVAYSHLKFLEF